MAVYHGYNGALVVGAVDLSDHVEEFNLVESYNSLSTTAMGDTHETRIAGIGSFVLTATFHQDQDTSEVFATLQPLNGTVATFSCKADSGTTTASNQDITGSVLISEFDYMNLAPDSLDTFSVSWAGDGALTVTNG